MDNEQALLGFMKPFKIIAFVAAIILLAANAMHKPMLSACCFIVLGTVGFICSIHIFIFAEVWSQLNSRILANSRGYCSPFLTRFRAVLLGLFSLALLMGGMLSLVSR
jgi:hypothetical protein